MQHEVGGGGGSRRLAGRCGVLTWRSSPFACQGQPALGACMCVCVWGGGGGQAGHAARPGSWHVA
jgi:hypothetical protein